jgi:hypothetical protein
MKAVLAIFVVCASPASAQADGPPDPSTVTLPDLAPSRDPRVIENGWKYFYFHKSGVSYEQAYADFADCYRFLPVPGSVASLPMFAPWTETSGVRTVRPVNNYGLVGSVIGGMVAGPLQRRARQSRMRRCMEPRGYLRYPIPEGVWEQLVDNYSLRSIAMQARAASGPKPDQKPVTE